MNNVVRMAKAPLFQIHPTLVASIATFVKYLFCFQDQMTVAFVCPLSSTWWLFFYLLLFLCFRLPFFPFVYQSSTMLPPTPDRPWWPSRWRRQQTNRIGAP